MKYRQLLLLAGLAAVAQFPVFAMHHTPAEKPKPSAKAAAVAFAPDVKADKSVESFFQALARALHTRDAKPAVARLAANFSIEGLPSDATQTPAEVFAQAVGSLPSPEEFVITSVRAGHGGITAKAELQFSSRVVTRTFKFDAAGNLVSSDLFKINTQPHGAATATPAPAATAHPAPVPAPAPATATKTTVSFAPGVEAHPHLLGYLEGIGEAVRTGDIGSLPAPRDNFTVAGLEARGPEAFRQALARFGGRLDEVIVTARGAAEGGGPTMNVTFRSGDRRWSGAFRFDANMLLATAELLPPAA